MKTELLDLLASPRCRSDLEMEIKKLTIHERAGVGDEEITDGILRCLRCGAEYPIIEGIPRLCKVLLASEKQELRRMRDAGGMPVREYLKGSRDIDYARIEQEVRKMVRIPENPSRYTRDRLENDIRFRVKECERQEKYAETLEAYYAGPVETVLDVGGGQGGLIKCLTDRYSPALAAVLDYDLSWVKVAKLRNPTVQIVRGDAACLPFKKASVDLVISTFTLEHIREHDLALREMCAVAKRVCFVSWGPNRFSLYDLGHLDAPVTMFPKSVGLRIAILHHWMRRTGRSRGSIAEELGNTHYISTTHFKRIMQGCGGRVQNVFVDFALCSLKGEYSYCMDGVRGFLRKRAWLARFVLTFLVLLRIEPLCYYLLKKE